MSERTNPELACSAGRTGPAWLTIACLIALCGCAAGSGIQQIAPDVFAVSEMRAPALGGGAEAHRAVLADADAFCRSRNQVAMLMDGRPDGDPNTPYWPTAFDATFKCAQRAGQ